MKKRDLTQPNRPLSINFTHTTLQRAVVAKQRSNRLSVIKELFTMKKHFLKQPAGALVAVALVIAGGAGAYAAANWFGGNVTVAKDKSIMTVDLSQCKGDYMPPGIESSVDRSNIKFKTTSESHISESDLQRKLLAQCENETVFDFYQGMYDVGSTAQLPAAVKATDSGSITLEINYGSKTFDKTIALQTNLAVYDKGAASSLASIKTGDFVVLAYEPAAAVIEGENPFDQTVTLKSLFKTQYDLRETAKDGKSLYESPNNITPLQN